MRETEWQDEAGEAPKSRSQIKREHHALQDLGRELVECPERLFKRLPLPEKIREEALVGRRLQRGALQRQLRHLGGLLEREDHAAIRQALNAAREPDAASIRRLHALERLRDALIAEGDGPLEKLADEFPALDRQHLRQLVRNARQEATRQVETPRATRALFQFLKALYAQDEAPERVDQ
jgi:ribosome-associated protein